MRLVSRTGERYGTVGVQSRPVREGSFRRDDSPIQHCRTCVADGKVPTRLVYETSDALHLDVLDALRTISLRSSVADG